MTETQFNELLDRYNQGLCTPEEVQQLERWMDNIREGASPFKSQAEKLKIKNSLRSAIHAKAGIPETKTRSLIPAFLRMAAAVALLAVTAYGIWTIGFNKLETTELASIDEIQKVILSDSTIVWLKPGSKLLYPKSFESDERIVSVTGEALFEVAKDTLRPFFVNIDDLTLRVVGTSFNIKPSLSDIEVLVLTGKVVVSANKTSDNVTLLPNEKVLFTRATNTLAKIEPPKEETKEVIKGTEYGMSFDHAKMADIIKAIELKFNVEVEVSDEAINNCLLSADFTDQSLGRTLKLISDAMDYTYEISDSKVTIKGSGCQ